MKLRIAVATLVLAASAALAVFLASPGPATATEPERWSQHAGEQTVRIDNRVWAEFLRHYVREHSDGVNRVDYAAVSPEHRRALKRWLASMQAIDVRRLTRAQQMAYWINLYNAATLDVVLDAYPVSSIREVRGGLLKRGPWDETLLRVGGEALSLDDVEHNILRPLWSDPRIHYAVNCASIGCPNLSLEPFEADYLEAQLDAAAIAFVNHPRAFRAVQGQLRTSSIYDWYAGDFGGPAGVLRHARRYAGGDQAEVLRSASRIAGYDYDWRLNDTRTR